MPSYMPSYNRQMSFSCVDPYMYLQIVIIAKCLVTFSAGKWLLSCVGHFMCLQNTTLAECLFTFGAGK